MYRPTGKLKRVWLFYGGFFFIDCPVKPLLNHVVGLITQPPFDLQDYYLFSPFHFIFLLIGFSQDGSYHANSQLYFSFFHLLVCLVTTC